MEGEKGNAKRWQFGMRSLFLVTSLVAVAAAVGFDIFCFAALFAIAVAPFIGAIYFILKAILATTPSPPDPPTIDSTRPQSRSDGVEAQRVRITSRRPR